jgi:LAS superfamily LD-carboxypeptidase LdcB
MRNNGFAILLATILCLTLFSSQSQADPKNLPLKEIFSKPQGESGDSFYFFIPQIPADKNQYSYVYDTKMDRLLLFPNHDDLVSKIEDREIDPKDWPDFLHEFILDEDSAPVKVIDLDDDWVKFTYEGRHIVLPRENMIEGWAEKNFPLGKEVVDKKTSLPANYKPDDLVKIDQKWNFHGPDYPKYLRNYVSHMIDQMLQKAEVQGIHIRVFSAFRSYEKQRYLFLNAVTRYGKNQNSVAKPGHSEHQLGTTVDLCGLDPKTVLSNDFDRTREGRWLKANAPKFGFYQSYTEENQYLTGYIPEPWHYRFLGKRGNFD